ncbi:MAG: histidine kinase dimerization/phospho-acceptor domain-containing protein [candidate division KSB1 bacterium]|nr:histidine kinase dimerization/phospho-acceptor domain-containing protein [candidate division KSB1 bacterium]
MHQLEKLKTIGTLAGGIAHEFNNLLTPILGYTDMALDSLDPDNALYPDLQQVYKAAERAKDLVQQMLTFSRSEDKDKKPLELQLITKEALKLLKGSIPPNVDFKQNIDVNCAPVLANPSQIQKLVLKSVYQCGSGHAGSWRDTGYNFI